MSVLVSIAAFVVALGVLVTVHEFGHFWVARRCGVRVLRFSIGFGRPLWRRIARDGTEYVIAAIPLGGYVRMLDERDEDAPADAPPQEAFNNKPVGRKIAIVLAGPAANFIFAVFAYWAMFVIGIPGLQPVVGEVEAGSPAAVAGMEPGDRLVAVGDSATPTWEAAMLALLDRVISAESVPVTVAGDDGTERSLGLQVADPRALTEPGALLPGLGITPWRPVLPAVLGRVESGGAAAEAGLASGDRVVTVDEEPVEDWAALVAVVQRSPGRTLAFGIERDGTHLRVQVTPDALDADGRVIGRIGAGPDVPAGLYAGMEAELRHGPLAALPHAAIKMTDMTFLTLKMLWRMITGDVSVKNISGPINIAQFAGYTASSGIIPFMAFMAIVSISLGIINLLPIPVLDGGHLMYHLAELVMGRPVSGHVEAIGQRVGFGMLALLMGLAFYNDLARIFG